MEVDLLLVKGFVLSLFVLVAAWTDAKSKLIPNRLVLALIASGVLFALWSGNPVSIGDSAIGIGIGFGAFFPLYLMSVMGAGDVKLMAAVGTFTGVQTVWVVATTLVTGMVLGLTILALFRYFPHWSTRAQPAGFVVQGKRGMYFPYAVAIAIGTLSVTWWPGA